MKILIVGDVHWSQYSSILRRRGDKYSYRLENLIKSVNWAENLAIDTDCDLVVYLGDFFDRAEINSEELSALKNICWSNKQHVFLVGNHEAGRGDLLYNSANIFGIADFTVVDNIVTSHINDFTRLVFIPYTLEEHRKPISECVEPFPYKTIIFSHNDIKGFQMGQFISKEGFEITDIQNNCDFYFNGHLHNGGKVADKIINVGNLTGQNFSEDGFVYDHSVVCFDTDTNTCAVYQNPHALYFYKIDFTENSDIDYINNISFKLKNAVATIKCYEDDLDYLRKRFDPNFIDELVPHNCNMVETRFIVQSKLVETVKDKEEIISINHLEQFCEYMKSTYGVSDILLEELQEVCK